MRSGIDWGRMWGNYPFPSIWRWRRHEPRGDLVDEALHKLRAAFVRFCVWRCGGFSPNVEQTEWILCMHLENFWRWRCNQCGSNLGEVLTDWYRCWDGPPASGYAIKSSRWTTSGKTSVSNASASKKKRWDKVGDGWLMTVGRNCKSCWLSFFAVRSGLVRHLLQFWQQLPRAGTAMRTS